MKDNSLVHLLDNLRSMLGEDARWFGDSSEWGGLANAFNTLADVMIGGGKPLGSLDAIVEAHLDDMRSILPDIQ